MSKKRSITQPLNATFSEVVASQVKAKYVGEKVFPQVKSPLRYPGGKTRAVSTIMGFMPDTLDCIASPFFGGGSVELALVSKGIRVYGYDAFKPLVLFWQEVIEHPEKLADNVGEYHPMPRDKFYDLQNRLKQGRFCDRELPAVFYALNRSSYSGTTMSGGMSPGHKRFTQSSIDRIRKFQSYDLLSVQNISFDSSLPKHESDFLYCDPPYANGGALYGERGDCHKGFDHEKLAGMLRGRDGWILSYNDCSLVRDLYSGFTILPASWTYGMNKDKKSSEVVILSKDFREYG